MLSKPSHVRRPARGARRARRDTGFTLIEILVVIAVISILASLVSPMVFRNVGDAKHAAALAQVEIFAMALDAYRLDNDHYPSSDQGLDAPREELETAQVATGANDTSQIVSFRPAKEEYGVNIMHVQEVILIGPITEMAQVPDYVRGLINLRGHVIPIIDLRVRFSLEAAAMTESSRIIILNLDKRTIGIVVDAVNEVLRISSDQIDPAPRGITSVEHQHVMGLVRFEEKLLILLNIEHLMGTTDG